MMKYNTLDANPHDLEYKESILERYTYLSLEQGNMIEWHIVRGRQSKAWRSRHITVRDSTKAYLMTHKKSFLKAGVEYGVSK